MLVPYHFLHVSLIYLFTILHDWLFLLIITLNSEFCLPVAKKLILQLE